MKMTLEEAAKIIEEAGDLEGSEAGEYWRSLLRIHSYYYMIGDKFRKAIEAEMLSEAKRIKTEFEIIEETEPVSKPRVYKSLVHKSELPDNFRSKGISGTLKI